jgi:leader peptidase (prepilin peptidase) / N-methyltransferase
VSGPRGAVTAMWRILDLPLGVFIGAAALAGLFVGNWLTVLTHRLPRMMEREWQAQCMDAAGKPRPPGHYGLWSPASHCPACEAPLDRMARIPLLGWLLLRGRCAACHAPIGWRYPVIELLTCALFAGCALRFGATPIALAAMGLSATLLALAWIDFETTLLPDVLTQPLVWAGLLVNLFDAFASVQMAVVGAVAGYLFLWVIFHVFRLLTGREGMGQGDFKLLAALGAWFGIEALPMLLLSASLVGVLIGGALTLTGRARRGQPLPFGPYLALAGLVMLLLGGEHGVLQFMST